MADSRITTLTQLLEKYLIEIPIAQRDYAQGRRDPHAEMVRSNLLRDMKRAVLEGDALDLSFVYGKKENQDSKFIPIDGQQRLTTLFLLHLYAFRRDDEKTALLSRFTYETRVTSRDFLKALIDKRAGIFDLGKSPSEEVEDSDWFVSGWNNDPTVRSALVMLDDIQETFRDVADLGTMLSAGENAPITFHFLDMDDIGMEDTLYIKLNARGKSLTEFENFKAQLIGRMKEMELPFGDEFEHCFDGRWTDLFWDRYRETFDRTYYAFFGVLLMNYGIISEDENWAHSLEYEKLTEDIFYAAFYILEFLCRNKNDSEITTFVYNALSDKRTYADRVLFHAVSAYLLERKGKDESVSMKAWIRIVRNLVWNSDIDNSERYRRALESLETLRENCGDIVRFFAQKGKVAGFNQLQIEEEQIKAGIIETDGNFAAAIYDAEQHLYFGGQIRSALFLARNELGLYEEESFRHYWRLISALFEPERPRYGNLLRQALLTFGDYTLPVSQFFTLCVDDPKEAARTPSLKALFSKCGEVTTELLDRLDEKEDMEAQLKKLIASSGISGRDWRYCFIHYPGLFRRMSVSHLRLRSLNGNIHIIQNKWANGYNYDLFLSALYEELAERKIHADFDDELGTTARHFLQAGGYHVFFDRGVFLAEDAGHTEVFRSVTDEPLKETADFIQNSKV